MINDQDYFIAKDVHFAKLFISLFLED